MAQKPAKRRQRVPQQSLLQRIRNNFLTGLVVVGPLFLTIYLVWLFVTFVDSRVLPLVPEALKPNWAIELGIPGFGVLLFLGGTTVIGYLTKGLFGRQMVRYSESVVDRMPVVRSIYNAVKQIIETIFQSEPAILPKCLPDTVSARRALGGGVCLDRGQRRAARGPSDKMTSYRSFCRPRQTPPRAFCCSCPGAMW